MLKLFKFFENILRKMQSRIIAFKNYYIEKFYWVQEVLLTKKHLVSIPKYLFPILLFTKLFHIIAVSTKYDKFVGNMLYVLLVAIWIVQFLATYKKGSWCKLVVGVVLAMAATTLLSITTNITPKDANMMNIITFWSFTIVFVYARIGLPLLGFEASTARVVLHSFELLLACIVFMPLQNTYLYHFLTVGGKFAISDSGIIMSIAASLAFDSLCDAVQTSWGKANA